MWTVGAHPHCVQLLNAWEQRGHLYLQMELCSGGSLQSYLEEFSGDFDELKVWRTLGDIAQGLEHIHGCDVIHLDIKPANIFITKNWKLKIGDFGLATKLPVVSSHVCDAQLASVSCQVILTETKRGARRGSDLYRERDFVLKLWEARRYF